MNRGLWSITQKHVVPSEPFGVFPHTIQFLKSAVDPGLQTTAPTPGVGDLFSAITQFVKVGVHWLTATAAPKLPEMMQFVKADRDSQLPTPPPRLPSTLQLLKRALQFQVQSIPPRTFPKMVQFMKVEVEP
jgi:hypothetical protein